MYIHILAILLFTNEQYMICHALIYEVFIHMFMPVEDSTFGLIKNGHVSYIIAMLSCLDVHICSFRCMHMKLKPFRDISHFHTVEYQDSHTTMQ